MYCCLQEYEALIDAALDYYAVESAEATSVLEERPEDAPVNMYADMDPELVGGIDAFGGEEEDFSDRGGQFVERILELGRVTKVGLLPGLQLRVCACVSAPAELGIIIVLLWLSRLV